MFLWELWWHKSGFSAYSPFLHGYTTILMHPQGTPVLPHSPMVLALGWVLQTSMNPYAAHNVLHLAAYVGSGIAMYALAFHETRDALSSFLAGYLFMFSHYGITQHLLGHLGESADLFLPIALLGLARLHADPGPRSALIFAAGSIGTCLSTPYLAFAWLAVGCPLFLAIRRREALARLQDRSFRIGLFGGLLAACAAGLVCYRPLFTLGNGLLGGSEPYSLSLLSFLDFPFWHPSSFIQGLRSWTSAGMMDQGLLSHPGFSGNPAMALKASSENLMGFFGFSSLALLALGLRRRAFAGQGAWGGLLVGGVVLSLGPFLQFRYEATALPLPYLALHVLPYLGLLRAPSRLIVLAFAALAMLAGVAFSDLTRRARNPYGKMALLVLLLCTYSWEMGLSVVGRSLTPLQWGAAYRLLSEDPSPGAVLELPAAIYNHGDITVNVQEYMLYQPRHHRPLVLGRPPRHTASSLFFCESTEFVYELTHPHVISILYARPELVGRRNRILQMGRGILRRNGIRYVLFHSREDFFSEGIRDDYARLLRDALGPPLLEDETGIWVFRV